jgi:hypothetical protein
MADQIKAKRGEGSSFAIHPAGQFAAVFTDLIDLGEKWVEWPGSPGKAQHKIVLLFRTAALNPDTKKPFEMRQEFTASMNEKSKLLPFVEAWLGKPFESEQAAWHALDNLHKLEGRAAFLSVVHKKNKAGDRTYAVINAIMPLPTGMAKPDLPAYERDSYWSGKRAEYHVELVSKLAQPVGVQPVAVQHPTTTVAAPPAEPDFSDFPETLEDDDSSLPF